MHPLVADPLEDTEQPHQLGQLGVCVNSDAVSGRGSFEPLLALREPGAVVIVGFRIGRELLLFLRPDAPVQTADVRDSPPERASDRLLAELSALALYV